MADTQPADLTLAIKHEAARLGFDHCRITPVGEAPHADFFDLWIEAGRAGDMAWLARNSDVRRWPARVARPGRAPVRTIVALAVRYHPADLPRDLLDDPSRGIIASYAWADEYHDVLKPRLYALDAYLRAQTGRTQLAKALVDSGPVLERDWAQAAGIGFTGKNTCTIHPGDGSWLLLANLFVPEVLAYDAPPAPSRPEPVPIEVLAGLPAGDDYGAWSIAVGEEDRMGTCGGCTRCLDACPTRAFVGPYHLVPQRCISYWTIETQQPIPRPLRPLFGNRIFGCDICQEVCPWNRRAASRRRESLALPSHSERLAPPLLEGFAPQTPYWLDEEAFAAHFRGSPILRATRAGMLRNVSIALGNWASAKALPALALALDDGAAAARGHAAWALGRLHQRSGDGAIPALLTRRLTVEVDAWVREEIVLALAPE